MPMMSFFSIINTNHNGYEHFPSLYLNGKNVWLTEIFHTLQAKPHKVLIVIAEASNRILDLPIKSPDVIIEDEEYYENTNFLPVLAKISLRFCQNMYSSTAQNEVVLEDLMYFWGTTD